MSVLTQRVLYAFFDDASELVWRGAKLH